MDGFNLKEDGPSMAETVKKIVESMPDGTFFYGNELKEEVARLCPSAKYAYVASVLHTMRRVCGDMVRCVDRNDSLYQKLGFERGAA